MLVRKYYFKLADAHIYYTDEVYNIIRSYGIPSEKIIITSNTPNTGVLLSTYSKIQNEAPFLYTNQHRILHVGKLVKFKRVDLILEPVQQLQKNIP